MQVAPLKARRLQLHADINRVTFESIVDPKGLQNPSGLKADLASLEAQIAPLQAEIDQLSRQFWVSKEQVRANKYDLSASRYREVDQDGAYYEKPDVTLERMLTLEDVMTKKYTNFRVSEVKADHVELGELCEFIRGVTFDAGEVRTKSR
jgi:type I restriction enzyme M protein